MEIILMRFNHHEKKLFCSCDETADSNAKLSGTLKFLHDNPHHSQVIKNEYINAVKCNNKSNNNPTLLLSLSCYVCARRL